VRDARRVHEEGWCLSLILARPQGPQEMDASTISSQQPMMSFGTFDVTLLL